MVLCPEVVIPCTAPQPVEKPQAIVPATNNEELEHPFTNARDASYVVPHNHNYAGVFKPPVGKKPEPAYHTFPPVYNDKIAMTYMTMPCQLRSQLRKGSCCHCLRKFAHKCAKPFQANAIQQTTRSRRSTPLPKMMHFLSPLMTCQSTSRDAHAIHSTTSSTTAWCTHRP